MGGTYGKYEPWRFKLVDKEGYKGTYFPQLIFYINPSTYSPYGIEPFITVKTGLTGANKLVNFSPSLPTKVMQFEFLRRDFYVELRTRYESGRLFTLVDHNKEVITGVLDEWDFTETSPSLKDPKLDVDRGFISRYNGKLVIVGVGKP